MVQHQSTKSPSSSAASTATDTSATSSPNAAPAAESDAGFARDEASRAETAEVKGFRCECLMNARYHSTREAFLDTVHRWFMFAVIALGAASVVDLAGDKIWLKSAFGAAAALFGTLDLVFDLSNRARAHALMKRRYFELLADVMEEKRGLIDAQACMNRFSADEEPAYHALIAASWNAAQEMVYGDEALKYNISGASLFWKNICRQEAKKFTLAPAG